MFDGTSKERRDSGGGSGRKIHDRRERNKVDQPPIAVNERKKMDKRRSEVVGAEKERRGSNVGSLIGRKRKERRGRK